MSAEPFNGVVRGARDQVVIHEDSVDSTSLVAGHLVEETSAGVQPHSSDGGAVSRVLVANNMAGRGYEVEDSYPDGEYIEVVEANSGAGLQMILAAGGDLSSASNADISEGDQLVSAGDGTLRAFDADDPDDVVGVADEAKDNSGASSGETTAIDITVSR